uniref:Uncharacterized protein n=1 Tax=Romanomermis culicivorax TaxID=13658 RepID=A0A915JXK4_ROMCU
MFIFIPLATWKRDGAAAQYYALYMRKSTVTGGYFLDPSKHSMTHSSNGCTKKAIEYLSNDQRLRFSGKRTLPLAQLPPAKED